MANQRKNIEVYVRVRQVHLAGQTENCKVTNNTIKLLDSEEEKTFHQVFDSGTMEAVLFTDAVLPAAVQFMAGVNINIITLGFTPKGKSTFDFTQNGGDEGLAQRLIQFIFDEISSDRSQNTFNVSLSFVEVKGKKITDLLCARGPLKLEGKNRGQLQIKDLTEKSVKDAESALKLISGAFKQLVISSGKSSAMLRLKMSKEFGDGRPSQKNCCNVTSLTEEVDLKADNLTQNQRNDGKVTNVSLQALKEVILALRSRRPSYVPYRRSNLTRLLEEAINGQNVTRIVASISPLPEDAKHALATLVLADELQGVQNKSGAGRKRRHSAAATPTMPPQPMPNPQNRNTTPEEDSSDSGDSDAHGHDPFQGAGSPRSTLPSNTDEDEISDDEGSSDEAEAAAATPTMPPQPMPNPQNRNTTPEEDSSESDAHGHDPFQGAGSPRSTPPANTDEDKISDQEVIGSSDEEVVGSPDEEEKDDQRPRARSQLINPVAPNKRKNSGHTRMQAQSKDRRRQPPSRLEKTEKTKPRYTCNCTAKACQGRTCGCRRRGLQCSIMCKCGVAQRNCKNPLNEEPNTF